MSESALLLRLVDLALLISTVELLWRLLRTPAGQRPWAPLAHLGAGLALMLALRLGLTGAGLWPVAGCLALSGLAHALDAILSRRHAGHALTAQERTSP